VKILISKPTVKAHNKKRRKNNNKKNPPQTTTINKKNAKKGIDMWKWKTFQA
jgi:hypothetical protein